MVLAICASAELKSQWEWINCKSRYEEVDETLEFRCVTLGVGNCRVF